MDYAIHTDVKYGPLELVDAACAEGCQHAYAAAQWFRSSGGGWTPDVASNPLAWTASGTVSWLWQERFGDGSILNSSSVTVTPVAAPPAYDITPGTYSGATITSMMQGKTSFTWQPGSYTITSQFFIPSKITITATGASIKLTGGSIKNDAPASCGVVGDNHYTHAGGFTWDGGTIYRDVGDTLMSFAHAPSLTIKSCVFDTSGLPAPDRPLARAEAASAERTRDAPPDGPGTDRADAPRGDAPSDQPRSDGARPELPMQDLSKPDQTKGDLPKPDLPRPDLPKPDQKKSDLPKPDQPKPPPSCASLFGAAPGYTECTASMTSCRFYFSSSGSTCSQLCGTHACLKMEDNESGQKCVAENPNACGGNPCTCSSSMLDSICTCSRQ
jgi:hypothetical protein